MKHESHSWVSVAPRCHTWWCSIDPYHSLCSSLPVQPHFFCNPQPHGFGLSFTSQWTPEFEMTWSVVKTSRMYGPPLCPSLHTASDWGCCFPSRLLYKLIWPETFALLGAKHDVMSADTSWRPFPLLTPGALVESGSLPHSLQLPKYHLAAFWQREEQHEVWNTETQSSERTQPLNVRER